MQKLYSVNLPKFWGAAGSDSHGQQGGQLSLSGLLNQPRIEIKRKKKTEYIAVYMIAINGKNINRQKIEDWNMELYLGN